MFNLWKSILTLDFQLSLEIGSIFWYFNNQIIFHRYTCEGKADWGGTEWVKNVGPIENHKCSTRFILYRIVNVWKYYEAWMTFRCRKWVRYSRSRTGSFGHHLDEGLKHIFKDSIQSLYFLLFFNKIKVKQIGTKLTATNVIINPIPVKES